MFNKASIVEKIIATLSAELEGYARSAKAARDYAADDQCKAENKYDTRGLESSYLSNGQSRQAAEVMHAMQQYESLVVRDFAPEEPINVGALLELKRKGKRLLYFLGPSAGGTEIESEGSEVFVITPQSPIGRQLIGRKCGERLPIQFGGVAESYTIAAVV